MLQVPPPGLPGVPPRSGRRGRSGRRRGGGHPARGRSFPPARGPEANPKVDRVPRLGRRGPGFRPAGRPDPRPVWRPAVDPHCGPAAVRCSMLTFEAGRLLHRLRRGCRVRATLSSDRCVERRRRDPLGGGGRLRLLVPGGLQREARRRRGPGGPVAAGGPYPTGGPRAAPPGLPRPPLPVRTRDRRRAGRRRGALPRAGHAPGRPGEAPRGPRAAGPRRGRGRGRRHPGGQAPGRPGGRGGAAVRGLHLGPRPALRPRRRVGVQRRDHPRPWARGG